MDVDLDGATWRKSTYSNGSGGNCVEVADLPSGRAVRDSKHPEGPILVFTREGWQAFVQGIRAGELCAELEPGQAAGICRESPGHNPMTARNDHSSETTGAGGESPREPLVDRQLELDLLRHHIARVTETGTGHAVLILGESGAGKSRLAVEAASEAGQRGVTVISVRCLGRGAEPLLPLKEALASYLGRTPDQIRRTLARAAPHLLDAVPFIGAFLASIGEKLAEGSFSLRGSMIANTTQNINLRHLAAD